jgi:L-amino acid N-acyltransferase YncA
MAMLSAAVRELRAQGFDQLASTVLLGNGRSIVWHWRGGFRPLAVL